LGGKRIALDSRISRKEGMDTSRQLSPTTAVDDSHLKHTATSTVLQKLFHDIGKVPGPKAMKIKLVYTIHRVDRIVGARIIRRRPTNAITLRLRTRPGYPVNGTAGWVLTEDL